MTTGTTVIGSLALLLACHGALAAKEALFVEKGQLVDVTDDAVAGLHGIGGSRHGSRPGS